VVLDLDLTLIHSYQTDRGLHIPCDFLVTNEELRGLGYPFAEDQRNVFMRPGLQEFLEKASLFADVIVWTLSHPELARIIVSKFDKEKHIKAIIGRDGGVYRGFTTSGPKAHERLTLFPAEALTPSVLHGLKQMKSQVNEPFYIKDLSLLGRSLNRVVHIDDWADLCVFNPDNAIIVEQYDLQKAGRCHQRKLQKGDPIDDPDHDDVLIKRVLPMLEKLSMPDCDVRDVLVHEGLRDHLSTHQFSSPKIYENLLHHHGELCAKHRPWVCDTPLEREEKSPESMSRHFRPVIQPLSSPSSCGPSSPSPSASSAMESDDSSEESLSPMSLADEQVSADEDDYSRYASSSPSSPSLSVVSGGASSKLIEQTPLPPVRLEIPDKYEHTPLPPVRIEIAAKHEQTPLPPVRI